MTDHLSELPDGILCYLLSFLTLRDSVRTRLLSPRWRYLYDNRSVLKFDAVNVFGSQNYSYSYDSNKRSKFVGVIDQFLEIREGRKLSALTIVVSLDNKQASRIDLWVESGIRMGIETLELNISPPPSYDKYGFHRRDDYVLSDKVFHSGKEFNLKCLKLDGFALTFSYGCTSWISHLTTLELTFVPLHQKDIECVMSGGLKLISLKLVGCVVPKFSSINVELPRIKKLYLSDSLKGIELNCPNLESLVCVDKAEYFILSHVPLLTQVHLGFMSHPPDFSLIFGELAKHAPKLETLSIYELTEIQPLPANNTLSCLKKLCLTLNWTDCDLFSVISLINASPFLETLHLQVSTHTFKEHFPQREYIDIPHFHLKDVNIGRLRRKRRELEFVRYLLKNSVALERIVIEEGCYCPSMTEQMGFNNCSLKEEEMGYNSKRSELAILNFFEHVTASYCSSKREEIAKTLLQGLKTNAELIFKTRGLGVVLKASNMVDYGVQLSRPGSEEHVQ